MTKLIEMLGLDVDCDIVEMDKPSFYDLYESNGSKLHVKNGENMVSFCGNKLFVNIYVKAFNPGDKILYSYDINRVCKRCLKVWRKSKVS